MSVSKVSAEKLATFIRDIRPDWDHPGIVAAIGKCRTEPLSEVAVALIRLAENGQAKTPALLPEPGRHWGRAALDDKPAGPLIRNRDNCLDHGNDRATCPDCERDRAKDAARPETIAAALAAARDAAANTRNRLGDQARRAVERGARP